ncbi:MAG: hypothetical protein H0V88_04635 [Pyrinomonadaceae bacterium]|nr:hypothetical protein [Pyrinomonadaceae bacterium]
MLPLLFLDVLFAERLDAVFFDADFFEVAFFEDDLFEEVFFAPLFLLAVDLFALERLADDFLLLPREADLFFELDLPARAREPLDLLDFFVAISPLLSLIGETSAHAIKNAYAMSR